MICAEKGYRHGLCREHYVKATIRRRERARTEHTKIRNDGLPRERKRRAKCVMDKRGLRLTCAKV